MGCIVSCLWPNLDTELLVIPPRVDPVFTPGSLLDQSYGGGLTPQHKRKLNTIVTQDDTKPRAPPPPASTAVFPQYSTSGPSDYAIVTKLEPSQMQELFRFKRPLTEVSIQHLEALNLQLHLNTPLEELVSKGFLPPKEWEREPNVTEEEMSQPSSETLSNSMAIPSHEAFYLRNRELHYESQDVYDFLARKVTPGKESAKVTHFRKFWISLHKVGTYWDSSMDKYSEEATGANGVSGESSSAMDIDNKQAPSSTTAGATSSSNGQGATYTGRRYSTGSAMPISHRMDLICDFIDGVIWPFGGRQERSRFQTYMELGLAKVPVDWSSVIYRSPKDRIRNRAGMLEGPLFATSCRTDVGTTKGKIPEVLDILKEVGNVIYLAQHREREGKTEPVRGVGKWWAEKPRWGGGSGEAVGKPLEEDEKEDPAPTASSNGAPTIKRRSKEARMAQRKNMTLQGYQKPKPTWEKKVTYSKIGKPAEDEFDTIYLLSSLNHHISILKARVHPKFLRFLAHSPEDLFPNEEVDLKWYGMEFHRSKWYDLFDPEERSEAMRGIWGIMGWIMRDGERMES